MWTNFTVRGQVQDMFKVSKSNNQKCNLLQLASPESDNKVWF